MEKYLSCTAFEDKFEVCKNFTIVQEEIIKRNNLQFEKKQVVYNCIWEPQSNIDSNLPFVIVPIKNNCKLLKYTFENFKTNNFFKHGNIILVDDRSEEDVRSIGVDYNVSYLRVDNSKGFNFSMLNNIAALISHNLGGKEIILWNSDLWHVKIDYFLELLRRHRSEESVISGSKLVYPIQSLHDGDSINIKEHFPWKTEGKYKDTIQFAGVRWVLAPSAIGNESAFVPMHYKRFADKEDPCVNCDTGVETVTGALQIINLQWFIKNGGFNPSLSKNFQDTDLCLRAIEQGLKVMYFGKDIYFYHDESYNFYYNNNETKMDRQLFSDNTLFEKLWSKKLPTLVF